MIKNQYFVKKRKEMLEIAHDFEIVDQDKFYNDNEYKKDIYDFYLNKINLMRKCLNDYKLIKSKEEYVSKRQDAVFKACYNYYVLNTHKEYDRIYYSFKEIADFIDDYGALHNGFSFIEIEMLNIMLDFLECKINLFKDSNNDEFIENDKKIIEHYRNYEYKVNYFGKVVKNKIVKLQV